MQAVVYRSGRGLVHEEIPRPEPGPGEVLIQVEGTGFCGSDHSMIVSGSLADGTILGHETCGRVAALGTGVVDPPLGTRVVIRPTWCGECPDCRSGRAVLCQNGRRSIGIGDLPGAFAEYFLALPAMLIPVPEGVDWQNAALAECAATGLHGINLAGTAGGPALVIGGGPIGLALIALLKILGFAPIVLSEPMAARRQLALTLGADLTMDPLNENIGHRAFTATGGLGFPTVFECSGSQVGLAGALDLAGRGGRVVLLSVIFSGVQISPLNLTFKELSLLGSYSNTHAENAQCLAWMGESRLDLRPLVTDLITWAQLPEIYNSRIHTGQSVKVLVQPG